MENSELADQVTIVTGGGRGLGQAIAQTLGKMGLKVVVAARTPAQLAETVDSIQQQGG